MEFFSTYRGKFTLDKNCSQKSQERSLTSEHLKILKILKAHRVHQLKTLQNIWKVRQHNSQKDLRTSCRELIALIRSLDEAIACIAVAESQTLLLETLQFYADPMTYFAVGFFPDSPYGEFMEDFSETEELGEKPGKRAREVLDKIVDLIKRPTACH